MREEKKLLRAGSRGGGANTSLVLLLIDETSSQRQHRSTTRLGFALRCWASRVDHPHTIVIALAHDNPYQRRAISVIAKWLASVTT